MDSIIDWGITLEPKTNLAKYKLQETMWTSMGGKKAAWPGSWEQLCLQSCVALTWPAQYCRGVGACNVEWKKRDGRLVSTRALLLTDIFTLHHCCQSAASHITAHRVRHKGHKYQLKSELPTSRSLCCTQLEHWSLQQNLQIFRPKLSNWNL